MLLGVRRWRPRSAETLFHHPLLTLERQRLAAGEGEERDALVLRAPDWVNVIALVDGAGGAGGPAAAGPRVVMVRQWRFGVAAETLELPGGVVEDPTPAEAALRELREETGYAASAVEPLGELSPNPALFANRCHTFLATGVELAAAPEHGPLEEQTVELVPLAEVPALIRRGEIDHALIVAAFQLLSIARPGLSFPELGFPVSGFPESGPP
jgi:8-oxo-dGTP pyrophosphatase MutT (NUDIX family)